LYTKWYRQAPQQRSDKSGKSGKNGNPYLIFPGAVVVLLQRLSCPEKLPNVNPVTRSFSAEKKSEKMPIFLWPGHWHPACQGLLKKALCEKLSD
jgi:hypothetical protein